MDPNSAQNGGQNSPTAPDLTNGNVPSSYPEPSSLSQTPTPSPLLNQTPLQEIPGQPQAPGVADQTQPAIPRADLPQVFTSNVAPETAMSNGGRKPKKGLIFLILAFILVVLLAGTGGLTWAVAYEKIKLEKYPDFQKKVSAFVMELPFTPKTPKFLLARTAMAHQDITKQAFDISMAIDSADLTSSLGLSNLDIQAKGAFDYSDPKNVFGNLELSFTKDFQMELRKKETMLYFKLNKLPSFLLAFLGISSAQLDPILDKWVSYDTTPLDTEARKSIQEDREVDPLSEEFIDENFEKYIDEEVLSKMELSSAEEEGHAVYKITMDADSDLIDHLGKKLEEAERQKSNYAYPPSYQKVEEKLSDFVKSMKWEIYIDKKAYYTRKVIVSVELEYDQSQGYSTFFMESANPLSQKNEAKIAFAMKFDKFGEEVVVEQPAESMTFEEFTELLSSTMNDVYGNSMQSSLASSRDVKRKSDLMALSSALTLYYADCAKYPSTLTDLTHTAGSENCQNQTNGGIYIMTIPTDPYGTDYFYQASSDSFSLCANMEIPPTTSSACPDSNFNYHVTPGSLPR
jgi:hypothetical protein